MKMVRIPRFRSFEPRLAVSAGIFSEKYQTRKPLVSGFCYAKILARVTSRNEMFEANRGIFTNEDAHGVTLKASFFFFFLFRVGFNKRGKEEEREREIISTKH